MAPITWACASGPPIAPALIERAAVRPPLAPGEIAVRWLGVAGFEVRAGDDVLLIDPYLSRKSLAGVAFGRVAPDEETLERALPSASLILVGHSHYDHLGDVPSIAARTGARIAGSRTTCLIAKAMARLGEDACVTVGPGRATVEVGPFRATAIPARHAHVGVVGEPLPGALERPPRWRVPSALEMPVGGALIWVIRVHGRTLVHMSSARLPEDPSRLLNAVPEGADVVLAAIALREQTPSYARSLMAELRPRVIVPHHHDPLFRPLQADLDAGAIEDARTFEREAALAGGRVRVLAPFEDLVVGRNGP